MTAEEEFGPVRPTGYRDAQAISACCPDGPSWVYTHLDEDGAPLYVGCTGYPDQRLKQHRRNASWFPQVREIRYLGPFTGLNGAAIERSMIRKHQPKHNKQCKADVIEQFIAQSERAS